MADSIDRQAAMLRIAKVNPMRFKSIDDFHDACVDCLKELPSTQPEQRWIPFKTRPMTEEEKEMHPDMDSILDCKLPDDGQAILVTIEIDGRRWVSYDEYYEDGGSYLYSGYEICTEATAWMPLPEPYKGEKHG